MVAQSQFSLNGINRKESSLLLPAFYLPYHELFLPCHAHCIGAKLAMDGNTHKLQAKIDHFSFNLCMLGILFHKEKLTATGVN